MESEADLTDSHDFRSQPAESQIPIRELMARFVAQDKSNEDELIAELPISPEEDIAVLPVDQLI
jgi:hypothetical protein